MWISSWCRMQKTYMEKPYKRAVKGSKLMKTNIRGVGVSERHSASATTISSQTSHDPQSKYIV